MNFILETLQVLLLSLWYNIESFIYLFVPMRKKNVAGEVVLITGAGSGIGRLMAQEFAALGTVLVLWDINQDGMKETAQLAKEAGASRVHYYLCDCSDKTEVYRVADQVRAHLTSSLYYHVLHSDLNRRKVSAAQKAAADCSGVFSNMLKTILA